MQVFKVTAASVMIVSAMVTFVAAHIYVATTPPGVPGIERITNWEPTPEEIAAERQENVEYYGKFQMIIDKSRIADFGSTASSAEYSSGAKCSSVSVRFVEMDTDNSEVDFVLECHRCYMTGDVSGGSVFATKGSERWELGFMQVGDHGVVFTNTVPPAWALEKSIDVSRDRVSENLLRNFGEIYVAETKGDVDSKDRISRVIVGKLIRLIDLEFDFKTNRAGRDST